MSVGKTKCSLLAFGGSSSSGQCLGRAFSFLLSDRALHLHGIRKAIGKKEKRRKETNQIIIDFQPRQRTSRKRFEDGELLGLGM
jgi:hypothetical protein